MCARNDESDAVTHVEHHFAHARRSCSSSLTLRIGDEEATNKALHGQKIRSNLSQCGRGSRGKEAALLQRGAQHNCDGQSGNQINDQQTAGHTRRARWLARDLQCEDGVLRRGHRRLHHQDKVSQRIGRQQAAAVGGREQLGEAERKEEETHKHYGANLAEGSLGAAGHCRGDLRLLVWSLGQFSSEGAREDEERSR